MTNWVELSTSCDRNRFHKLSEWMSQNQIENRVEFVETTLDNFAAEIEVAKKNYKQIRIGGELRTAIREVFVSLPSNIMTIGSADGILWNGQDWWPRNYLIEGISRSLSMDVKGLDTSQGAFISGTTPDCRALVYVLSRLGFKKFSISDSDEDRGEAFCRELERYFFSIQFQFVPRHLITQLPAVHSVAANTLTGGMDAGITSELIYLNFLSSGGVWLDLVPQNESKELKSEALNVGAKVIDAYQVLARTDRAWVEASFGRSLEIETLFSMYKELYPGTSTINSDV